MRLRQIEVFRAVMLAGTVSGAARLLNVTQPAVTNVLLHTEDELGIKLFERIKGRLYPTAEGRALYAEVERAFADIENLRKLAANLRGGRSGNLRITASPALCIEIIPLAICRFLQKHPDVNIQVETHNYRDVLNSVLVQNVDIGFTFNPQPHPALDAEPIAEGSLVGLFPSAMADGLPERVSLASFQDLPLIGLHTDDPLGNILRGACQGANVLLAPRVEVKTNRIALALVQNGAGAAILDQYTAASADPERVRVKALQQDLRFTVNVIRARHHTRSVIEQHFVAEVVEVERLVARAAQERLGG
ncbi:LysR family transcriptional regulator [Azospirillum thermophilum]|uniref:LysR family transcriptional regulator n=1 Tax=Azospirillum thermophilum TaxID=2202148 RepID=A0A2S2CYG9_9PROT|nr:LysR substrate-binding domain-containing protein [Azospirillum thermophilum]AWK89562.1 LysR family transcriptional regulator [Azospirillum thermophilum]